MERYTGLREASEGGTHPPTRRNYNLMGFGVDEPRLTFFTRSEASEGPTMWPIFVRNMIMNDQICKKKSKIVNFTLIF